MTLIIPFKQGKEKEIKDYTVTVEDVDYTIPRMTYIISAQSIREVTEKMKDYLARADGENPLEYSITALDKNKFEITGYIVEIFSVDRIL